MVIVASPEEMPVAEAIDLAGRLGEATRVDLAAVVVNRVLPELFGRGEEALFERLRQAPLAGRACRPRWARASTPCSTPPSWRCACVGPAPEHLDALRRAVGDRLPVLYVPELFHRTPGRRSTAQIAEALGEELGL